MHNTYFVMHVYVGFVSTYQMLKIQAQIHLDKRGRRSFSDHFMAIIAGMYTQSILMSSQEVFISREMHGLQSLKLPHFLDLDVLKVL